MKLWSRLIIAFLILGAIGYQYSLKKIKNMNVAKKVEILTMIKSKLDLKDQLKEGDLVKVTNLCESLHGKLVPTKDVVYTIYRKTTDYTIISDSSGDMLRCKDEKGFLKSSSITSSENKDNNSSKIRSDLKNKTVKVSAFCKEKISKKDIILKDELIDVFDTSVNFDLFRITLDGLMRSTDKRIECPLNDSKISILSEEDLYRMTLGKKKVKECKSNNNLDVKKITGICYPIGVNGTVDFTTELRLSNFTIFPTDLDEDSIRGFVRIKSKTRYVYCNQVNGEQDDR